MSNSYNGYELRGKFGDLADLLITGLEGPQLADNLTYRLHSIIWTKLWGILHDQLEMELEVQLRERLIEDMGVFDEKHE